MKIRSKLRDCEPYFIEYDLLPKLYLKDDDEEQTEYWIFFYYFVNGLFSNIFNKHTAEHIDTTDKFSKAHTEVIDHLPPIYEKELHSLEKNNKKIFEMLENIIGKIDILIEYSTYNKK